MNNKLVWHQVVLGLGMVVLMLNKILFRGVPLSTELVWWAIGMVAGFVLVFGDRLIYAMVSNPSEGLSVRFGQLMSGGKWVEGLKLLLAERSDQKELAMRSALFALVYLVLGFFMLTSSNNNFGRGMVVGLGLHLVFDMLSDFSLDKQRFNLWFWQIKRQLPESEKQVFMFVVVALYMIMAVSL